MSTDGLSFKYVKIDDGLNLHLCPTEMFKTVYLRLFIQLPLDEQATSNSLVNRVVSRGCKKYPNMRKITTFMESLYGAGFGSDIIKIGERHIQAFSFNALADRFLPKKENILEKGVLFLKRLLTEPLIEANGFNNDFVAQEKQNLKNDIKGLKDNKMAYAQHRCVEIMCEDEPFHIYEEGRLEDINKLDTRKLLARLKETVNNYPMDIFVLGKFSVSKLEKAVRNNFKLKRTSVEKIPETIIDKEVKKERVFKEHAPEMEQAKLVMGYRTYTSWKDEDVYPMMLFTGIFGGYPHAKLFRNVREKAGLAYYASAAFSIAFSSMNSVCSQSSNTPFLINSFFLV